MCGIFGIVRHHVQKANSFLVDDLITGISRLEYRGYDSAGIAIICEWQEMILRERAIGKVHELESKVANNTVIKSIQTGIGIAHTRWATHGWVEIVNCHPHLSGNGRFALVHNGIIENYQELKNILIAEWVLFEWQTDSEVVVAMIERASWNTLEERWLDIAPKLQWAYAFLIIDRNHPDELLSIRNGSPLIFGKKNSTKEFYLTSDQNALAGFADDIIFLEDGEYVYVTGETYKIFSPTDGERRVFQELMTTADQVSKWSFEHFMLKEIYEQSDVITNALMGRIDFDTLSVDSQSLREIKNMGELKSIHFIACGTSYHACLYWSKLITEYAHIPTYVHYWHEAIEEIQEVDTNSLYIFVSQSGETADTLDPLKYLKHRGARTFSIVNVVGSSIARLCDAGLYTRAGVEIGVASTKAFTGQCIALLLLAITLATSHGQEDSAREIIYELGGLSTKIADSIKSVHIDVQKIAEKMSKSHVIFFLAREIMIPIAHEWALKLREISYQPTIALPAGELKHGSLALIDKDTTSICIMGLWHTMDRNRSSLHEIKARGGYTIALADRLIDEADETIIIPSIHKDLSPIIANIALQLLSYETALALGRDIDKPRNLAKSVTVR